ncbi:MAG TPA: hypothetical protein VGO53_12780, partial [Steroidobacteraceae bacterium]|nr:hypothetical protein [Steroidobacteraceae bacterium]
MRAQLIRSVFIRSARASGARLAIAALAISAAYSPVGAAAEASAKVPNINGAWATYPGLRGGPSDPKLVPPPATPLLLKAKYKSAYDAMRAKQIESDKAGEPLSNASTACLPTGMPGMMFAIYPIEFIQSPGQVTIVAEAMSQVRRVYLDKPQLKIEDVPPGFYGHSVGHWEGGTLL